MRIAENLEVRFSQSGKTFQIVSTGGKYDRAIASFTREIGDQIFGDEQVIQKLVEMYNSMRDELPSRETLKNDFTANQHEAKVYRATPFNKPAKPKLTLSKEKKEKILSLLLSKVA